MTWSHPKQQRLMRAEPLTGVVTDHGEGVTFSPRWAGPRWVDMLAGEVCERQPDGTILRQRIDTVAAVLRPRRNGGTVVVGEHHLWLSADDQLTAPFTRGPRILTDPSARMNEGGCDPDGNLYAGSMAYDQRPGAAALYRVDRCRNVTAVATGLTISNGIEWSPDGHTAYYADTPTARIDQFDWTPELGLTNRRPFAVVEDPDGLTVDAEGGIWVARFGAGTVERFDQDGQRSEIVHLPVRQVTAVTFAGEDLRTMIITTSRHGLGAYAEPLAGALFTCEPGTRGQPVRQFAG